MYIYDSSLNYILSFSSVFDRSKLFFNCNYMFIIDRFSNICQLITSRRTFEQYVIFLKRKKLSTLLYLSRSSDAITSVSQTRLISTLRYSTESRENSLERQEFSLKVCRLVASRYPAWHPGILHPTRIDLRVHLRAGEQPRGGVAITETAAPPMGVVGHDQRRGGAIGGEGLRENRAGDTPRRGGRRAMTSVTSVVGGAAGGF